jgi:hypothetical protein
MHDKLNNIFHFLKENHATNKALQLASIKAALMPFSGSKAKIKSLLMDVANTQSSPKLDALGVFWNEFDKSEESFTSAQSLVDFLAAQSSRAEAALQGKAHVADQLFNCLKEISGFGEKTAALFVKQLVIVHLDHEDLGFPKEKLAFLEDSQALTKFDDLKLYLPVDAVIRHIFIEHLGYSTHAKPNLSKADFKSINDCIFDFMKNNAIPAVKAIYWDDLWYWGFITQHGGGNNRKTQFNPAKYSSLKTSTEAALKEINAKATAFINQLCA